MAQKINTPNNTVDVDFPAMFKSVAAILDTLESKIASQDNIGNWITQVFGNGDFSHPVHISFDVDGKLTVDVEIPENFMPASSKGDSSGYAESCRVGQFNTDSLDTAIILLAYNIGWMLLGKPLASVNMARGLIIAKMVESLKISNLEMTIRQVSFGGDKPKIDIAVNQDEIVAMANYLIVRSKRVMSLANRSGKTHHVNAASTVKLVKTVKTI